MTERTNWKAPCVLCGYNGPGFFQPSTHPCAAHDTERDALVAEVKRLRGALYTVMGACDAECAACGAYYVAKKALDDTKEKP